MGDGYHHGNLRQALIDAGIKIINESGEENLSLRKAASLCGVSHAAPYAHFKDKEELIEAIKKTVTDRFMQELEEAEGSASSAEEAILCMGRRYVSFFAVNPDYFRFLFGKQNIAAHLQTDKEYKDDYPPFLLLKEVYLRYLREQGLERSGSEKEIELIRLWSTVHGLASLACMPGVETSFRWEEKIWDGLLLH